ncbi:uncharacterized protein LOC135688224 isoform X1 [Rhopilema esculentum]|uniref:uncharacterized protein LOC135688224 isoform X1 n=1 Tax=Rhopilema esculentum TaxID=499914 RepID=UPI0031D2602F|eukprot:gene7209-12887_t
MLFFNSVVNWLSLLAIFCSLVTATILRLPCITVADFKTIYIGRRFNGYVISTIKGVDDMKCTMKCVHHFDCRSYNINVEKMLCELNSKAHVDTNGTNLIADTDWIYKSTDFEDLLVGQVCKELNPCGPGVLCKDKCEPPYYECAFCSENLTGPRKHCNKPVDGNECSSNPCMNSGTCTDMVADYKCTCMDGYTGKNCETDIDECESLPCFNGGICSDSVANYTCSCAVGYFGSACQFATCKSLKTAGVKSGLHHIFIPSGIYQVYCEMDINGGGYTFIPNDIMSQITTQDIETLFTLHQDVLLSLQQVDGSQLHTVIHQYDSIGRLSVQINAYNGYTRPKNGDFTDFLYLGTWPAAHALKGTDQGFLSNGVSITFRNCDGNQNNRLVFYSKPNSSPPNYNGYYEQQGFAVRWRATARPHPVPGSKMPSKFYLFTEAAYGGCGCYTESSAWPQSAHSATGTAIGIR